MRRPRPYTSGREVRRESVGLPPRPFLYTLDQVSYLTDIPLLELVSKYVYYDGRSEGSAKQYPRSFVARNIAPADDGADWRIAEPELVRWLRHMGFKYYEVGWVQK